MRNRTASTLLLSLVFILFCAWPVYAEETPPQIFVDGKLLQSDVSAVIEEGRVLAPLRAVFEALGSTIEYEPQTQSIDAYKGTTHVFIAVGLSNAVINGSPVFLDVPAKIINGRTMVPLRFVSEAMGAEVTWNGDMLIMSWIAPTSKNGSNSFLQWYAS